MRRLCSHVVNGEICAKINNTRAFWFVKQQQLLFSGEKKIDFIVEDLFLKSQSFLRNNFKLTMDVLDGVRLMTRRCFSCLSWIYFQYLVHSGMYGVLEPWERRIVSILFERHQKMQ